MYRGWMEGSQQPQQALGIGQSLAGGMLTSGYLPLQLAVWDARWAVSAHALGGAQYDWIKRGTVPFAESVAAGGVILACVHGEKDSTIGTSRADYAAYMLQWQRDYSAALALPVPLVISQVSSKRQVDDSTRLSDVAYAQTDAANDSPFVFMMGPRYQYRYETERDIVSISGGGTAVTVVTDGRHNAFAGDSVIISGTVGFDGTYTVTAKVDEVTLQYASAVTGSETVGSAKNASTDAVYLHLTWEGYRHLACQMAKVLNAVYTTGAWEPLQPTAVVRSGATVTISMNVPVAPLQVDTTTVPAVANYGFEWIDNGDGNSVSISGVAVNSDNVVLTLSDTPTGTGQRVAYARSMPATAYTNAGGDGALGNIRDSDATALLNSPRTGLPYDAHNWLVHFDEAVTT